MEQLLSQLEERGYRGRVVSAGRLRELYEEIEERHRLGTVADELYRSYLAGFTPAPPESMPDAESLIVVAVPQPQSRMIFEWHGKRQSVVIPPTYMRVQETDSRVGEVLAEALGPRGYRVVEATAPKKLLAARSGLGAYGKNNICYVEGMGSFHRLAVFFSDMPCGEDTWQEAQMMEHCQKCSACVRKCPAGAITTDRFLIHAERCITFHNEKPGGVPFPDWMDPSWHNCLVGCLVCQKVCPKNRDFLGWFEEMAEFSEEETALLLRGADPDSMPAPTAAKLKQLDDADILDVVGRNLGVLLE